MANRKQRGQGTGWGPTGVWIWVVVFRWDPETITLLIDKKAQKSGKRYNWLH